MLLDEQNHQNHPIVKFGQSVKVMMELIVKAKFSVELYHGK